jgi:hypothetical protein
MLSRRTFVAQLVLTLVCAPTIVRASSLMPLRGLKLQPALPPGLCCEFGPHYAGFVERLGYQWMVSILRTGYTPERASCHYGGMTEESMRRSVAYARRHGYLPPE